MSKEQIEKVLNSRLPSAGWWASLLIPGLFSKQADPDFINRAAGGGETGNALAQVLNALLRGDDPDEQIDSALSALEQLSDEQFERISQALLDQFEKAMDHPEGYPPDDMALACKCTGILLAELGEPEEAVEIFEQTLLIYRELADEESEDYFEDVAEVCFLLANQLAEIGRREEAIELLLESLEISEAFGEEDPQRHLAALAMTHLLLGVLHRELGDMPKAQEHAGHSLYLSALIAAQDPQEHLEGLGIAMGNAQDVLEQLSPEQRQQWLGNLWEITLQTIHWRVVPVAGVLAEFFLEAGLAKLAFEPLVFGRMVLERVGAEGVDMFDQFIEEVVTKLSPSRASKLEKTLRAKFIPLLEGLPD